jgi:hypothetical protein
MLFSIFDLKMTTLLFETYSASKHTVSKNHIFSLWNKNQTFILPPWFSIWDLVKPSVSPNEIFYWVSVWSRSDIAYYFKKNSMGISSHFVIPTKYFLKCSRNSKMIILTLMLLVQSVRPWFVVKAPDLGVGGRFYATK